MGAVVAANVAVRYPARVASAALVAPPSYADSAASAQATAGWVADLNGGAGMSRFIKWIFPGTSDSVATAWSAEALAANPPATVAAAMRSMAALMVPATRASTVRVPALVAAGPTTLCSGRVAGSHPSGCWPPYARSCARRPPYGRRAGPRWY
jgi:pimeloyl-ACP methyl ester carboxylesterase